MLGLIFRKSQNKIQDPAKLRRLIVDLIDREQWMSLDADVKGDAYEGLLDKNAQDTKGGAGQYFTPRPLIRAMAECMRPGPDDTICDPACGTGGFLLAAHDYIDEPLLDGRRPAAPPQAGDAARRRTSSTASSRLCAMNLLLHGIGPSGDEATPPIETGDSLATDPGDALQRRADQSAVRHASRASLIVNEEGETEREDLTVFRDDFWATTSNKQLNFLQHVHTLLEINGRAAVVVPDNVLFEGGAGETVRRRLLQECDVHTLLRLPTGIFYAQGVKANVLFFDKRSASATASTRDAVDLRPAHQPALHAEDEAAPARRPRRVRRLLQPGESPPAHRDVVGGQPDRPLAPLHLRRADPARQGEPRHLLAPRREPRRLRQPPRAGRDRRRDHRGPAGGPGAARGNTGGLGDRSTLMSFSFRTRSEMENEVCPIKAGPETVTLDPVAVSTPAQAVAYTQGLVAERTPAWEVASTLE